jgi:hypothetical protein
VVFRIQARLRFASVAARTAGHTTINSAISGRNTTVRHNFDEFDMDGTTPVLVWEGEEQDTGDAGIIYALIQAMASPLVRSRVSHHTCLHGDQAGVCLVTAEKVW